MPGGAPYGTPSGPPALSPYRPLRRTAIVSTVLMGLTAIAAAIQTVVLWSAYDDVKRFIYGLVSDAELERGVASVAGTGLILDLLVYLLLGTAVAFVIWLWQARENTELFDRLRPQVSVRLPVRTLPGAYPAPAEKDRHRHSQGWVIGSWICPIVQFWYPLQIVQDVVDASEPPPQHPAAVRSGGTRALLYGWWAAWTTFWVILVGGVVYAVGSLIVWTVQLVDARDTSTASGDYVDIYDLQDFMVRLALGVNIGFTLATGALVAAGVMISVVMLRVSNWQDERGRGLGVPPGVPPQFDRTPPGAGQQVVPPAAMPTFPSYGGGYQHQSPPGGTPPAPR
jgi:hypothetical protein